MDDAVTTNNRSLESAQNRIEKDIKKLETDTEKQRNRQNNMYAESQSTYILMSVSTLKLNTLFKTL